MTRATRRGRRSERRDAARELLGEQPPGRTEENIMGTIKSDSQIQQDVINELRWDTRVDETDVGVEVDRAVVTLTGTVDNWAKRVAAQEAAHRVSGVLDVANDIQVRIAGVGSPTDTEIAQSVRKALELDVMVPDAKIQTTVTEGGVMLTGTVDFFSQRNDAERAIRNLTGVRWVINKIQVHGPTVAAGVVRAAIEKALERHAERLADGITLDVKDGKVTIAGTAQSWRERRAIIGAAMSTPGVLGIEDKIRVQP
jgi:osmotically-inducible protein OsmY